jgi:hypothetical protein
VADAGEKRSPKHSLDRWPDPNDHYEPSNVKWSTPQQQTLNRRNNRLLHFNGKSLTCSQWAAIYDLNQSDIHNRLKRHWPTELAILTPSGLPYDILKSLLSPSLIA